MSEDFDNNDDNSNHYEGFPFPVQYSIIPSYNFWYKDPYIQKLVRQI